MKDFLSIYHLSYFLEVAVQKSYSRAAEKLNITQPALSKCVRGLEEVLGTKLISYTNHVFSLTPAGEQFENAIRIFLQQYDNMLCSVKTENELLSGTVKLGIPASIIDAVFVNAAKNFISKNTGVTLNVIDGDSSVILDGLSKGHLDLGIVMLSSTLPAKVEIFPLLHDICYVVMNKSNPLANADKINLSQLAGENFLMAGELSSLYITFQRMCEHTGTKPNIIYQGMTPKFFMEMISQGQCVTVFPMPFIEMYKTENLVWRPLDPPLEWNVALLAPSDRHVSGAAAFVRDFLIDFYSKGS